MTIKLKGLGANIPADFLRYANYCSNRRYIGIYYQYQFNNAVWSDGLSLSTFHYYCLYNPLIYNPYMLIELDRLGIKPCDFGTYEMMGNYYLIVDRKNNCSINIIDREQADRLLIYHNEMFPEIPSIVPYMDKSLGDFEYSKSTPLYLQEFSRILEDHFCKYLTKEWFLSLSEDEIQLMELHFCSLV